VIELVQLGREIQDFIQSKGWPFCFIGGLAVLRWGEPRFTQDVDLTLLTGFGNEEPYVDALIEHFRPRVKDARTFALEKRVALLQSENGIGIDVALAGLPFEENAIGRSTPFEYAEGISLRTCSAEDLIVMKAFADRERDWLDVRGIVIRQGSRLSWPLIRGELKPLCELKENPDILPHLERIRAEEEAA